MPARRVYPSRCRRGLCSVPRCKEEQTAVVQARRADGSVTSRGLCPDHLDRRSTRLARAG